MSRRPLVLEWAVDKRDRVMETDMGEGVSHIPGRGADRCGVFAS
jgi:hypothetical protein